MASRSRLKSLLRKAHNTTRKGLLINVHIWLSVCLALGALSSAKAHVFPELPDKPADYVTDAAGVLSATERSVLSQRCAQIDRNHLGQIAIVTITSLAGESIDTVSLSLARKWGVGRKGVNDGILIMLAIGDHRSRIEVGSGLETRVTNDISSAILTAMRPDLARVDIMQHSRSRLTD